MTRRGYPMRQSVTQREPDQASKCDELGTKTFCTFGNNKPWFYSTPRNLRRDKGKKLTEGDWRGTAGQEPDKKEIKAAKGSYSEK
ncbi:hypothetical protein CRENBAI_007799 [Crenichthys baileyi]|uniref:Uncharacterized protein n=1 Tax=Crenichthys baileyi TaxID=28760 RepID=A0AAV9RMS5_9TELE